MTTEHDVVLLRDGTMARIRPATPEDREALAALVHRLSPHTLYLRFFSASDAPALWYVDQVVAQSRAHSALVAERLGEVVAVASWVRMEADPDVGDVALLVDDAHQALGLGSLLLEHLARLAWSQGLSRLHADVLVENSRMVHVFRHSGLPVTVSTHQDVLAVDVTVAPSPALSDAILAREAVAERASLRPLLAPRSIAVLGSSQEGKGATRIVQALQRGGFTGTVHHVGPDEHVADLPDPPHLAVLALPAEHVVDAASDCARAGVRALVVVSAGFAETGPAGRAMQEELVDLAREHDMRVVGPNCLGVLSTDPAVRMNATFCDAAPVPGGIALVSQSGAVGLAALRQAEWSGTGLSVFVSTGNKADVSGNDVLLALHDDPRTRVIALYLESFGNAQKFAQVAAWVGRRTPVVVLKSGRTAAGALAGASHTAAAATTDAAVDALLRKARAVRADSVPELFDLVALLDLAPVPRGKRVAVVGNSGGLGVLAADALVAAGLDLAPLSESTTAGLAAQLPTAASLVNPVDLLATAAPEDLRVAVELALQDPSVDAVLATHSALTRADAEPYATVLAESADKTDKPLIACFPGILTPPAGVRDGDGRTVLPTYSFVEQAAKALGKVVHWALRPPPPEPAEVRALAPTGLPPGWAGPDAVDGVLRGAGLPGIVPRGDADGFALLVGVVREPTVGPLVHVGAGGPLADVLDDHSFLLPPVTRDEAREAVLSLRCSPYLQGHDLEAVVDTLVALSDVARGLPEIAELEVNPLIVTADGARAVDGRVRVAEATVAVPMPSRALRHP